MRQRVCVLSLCLLMAGCSSNSPFHSPSSPTSPLVTPGPLIVSIPQPPTSSAVSPTTTAEAVAVDRPAATLAPFAPVIVAEEGDGIEAPDRFDVELVSHVETAGPALDVVVDGDYAYVADAEVGLQVVDVGGIRGLSGLTAPFSNVVGEKPPGLAVAQKRDVYLDAQGTPGPGRGARARRLALQDDLVYFVGGGALLIVDVSDHPAPRTAGRLDLGGAGSALDVAVAEDHAYVASGVGGVRIIDTSDPTAPSEVSAWVPEDTHVQGVAVGDGTLYAAASGAGLRIVDVSDPLQPVEKASLAVPLHAWDAELLVNNLYVAWNMRGIGGRRGACGSGVTLVDVGVPETPEEAGQYCDPGGQGVSDVAIDGRTIYVAAGHRGVRVLDFSNRNAPIEIGHYDTPGDAVRVVMKGNRLYVADREGGLFILRFTPNGFPANEDGTIRVGISQPSYALRERIEVELVMLAERVMLQGACDWWFERETARGWERVGSCPKSALTDEPTWHQRGERVRISLPTSDTDNVYTYNYNLTPGVYRYVQRYGTRGGSSACPSPPFEIVAD